MSEKATDKAVKREHKSTKTTRGNSLRGNSITTTSITWPQMNVGDCSQLNCELLFESDGSGTFSCSTWTNHTVFGDVWHSTFDVFDANGVRLFVLGDWDSPSMNVGSTPGQTWGFPFRFPVDSFDRIASATQYYSC